MQGLRALRSSFFWRLVASYCAVVLVTSATILLLLGGSLLVDRAREIEQRLERECELLAPYAIAVLEGEQSADGVAEAGAAAGVRITLIADDGRVVAESARDPAGMDDHGQRPEVVAARSGGFGVSRRFSSTLRDECLYVALRVDLEGEEQGFVRLSILQEHEREILDSIRGNVFLGATFGSMVALAIGLFVARKITKPIREMKALADDFRANRFDRRVHDLPDDEIGLLGATLNRLGAEATRRIATISKDDARLRAMLAGMVEGVIAVDESDRIVFCNQAAASLLEMDREQVRGSRLWEQVRIAGLDELLREAHDPASSGSSKELVVVRDDGERTLQAHGNSFRAEGDSGVVVVLQDVTELRRLELVRRDFVANVSHELKTPLTAIKGFVETLLSGAVDEPGINVRFLGKVDANVERLNRLVADLLSLARIESQDDGVPLVPVDWGPIVAGALARQESVTRRKNITCTSSGGPLAVLGDAESMTQVVENLLDNAVKYTGEGGTVSLELVRDGDHGVLRVTDSGVGIPAEDLERVFERFYRVDKARSREMGGTGLGLAIVKHLVQAMSGTVRVSSDLGRGSRFEVSLGIARPAGRPL